MDSPRTARFQTLHLVDLKLKDNSFRLSSLSMSYVRSHIFSNNIEKVHIFFDKSMRLLVYELFAFKFVYRLLVL